MLVLSPPLALFPPVSVCAYWWMWVVCMCHDTLFALSLLPLFSILLLLFSLSLSLSLSLSRVRLCISCISCMSCADQGQGSKDLRCCWGLSGRVYKLGPPLRQGSPLVRDPHRRTPGSWRPPPSCKYLSSLLAPSLRRFFKGLYKLEPSARHIEQNVQRNGVS